MEEIAPAAAKAQSSDAAEPEDASGVGLEIVTIADLPDAENYGDHEFYHENFSASEIAYCLRKASAKASFGGLLAAKKAIVKSGAALGPLEDLRQIEITHDAEGRPSHSGCLLSISHAGAIAAAVAWRQGGSGHPGQSVPPPGRGTRRGPNIFASVVLASLLFLFGFGLWKILSLALGKHF